MDADEPKLICGVPHVKVRCVLCKGMVWSQQPSKGKKTWRAWYRCKTCTEVKDINVGKGIANDNEWD